MKYSSNPDTITRDYFDSLLLETRYIDSVLPTTKMTLWGETFDTPVMTAALSHLHNTAQDGMSVYAEGAAKAGAVHWVGMGEDEELENERLIYGSSFLRIRRAEDFGGTAGKRLSETLLQL